MSTLVQYRPPLIIGDGGSASEGSFSASTASLNVSDVDKDRMWYVPERIAEVTNPASGTYYYPMVTGFCQTGFPLNLAFTAHIDTGAATTFTLTIEGTNDVTTGYWVPCTEIFRLNDNTYGNASIAGVANSEYIFGLDVQSPPYLYYRVVMAIAGPPNIVIAIDMLRFPGA